MDLRPIPAFYCCYLLRSTIRHSSLYVGSTPNPKRRLAQHNGISKGGAVRTSRSSLRPWEMACIVTGFPSNIAALQFEWAWQNTHLTRRIADDQRITIRETITRVSKSGRPRRRPARPRMSLMDKLSNLHLLLRVPSFARWPLEVRFFSEDVYLAWQSYAGKADINLGRSIKVVVDANPEAQVNVDKDRALSDSVNDTGEKESTTSRIGNLHVNYLPLKDHVEKSLFILAENELVNCAVCNKRIQTPGGTTLVCPSSDCRAAFHISCLSKDFLKGDNQGIMIPSTGKCPRCRTDLQWVELVKELSLRMRGEKEVAKLMKKPKERKSKATKGKKILPAQTVAEDDLDDDEEDDLDDEGLRAIDILDEPFADEARSLGGFDDDDMMSVTSLESEVSLAPRTEDITRATIPVPRLEIVIEDSDWDSAEVLD